MHGCSNLVLEEPFFLHHRIPSDFLWNYKETQALWEQSAGIYSQFLNLSLSSTPLIPQQIHQIWIGSTLPDHYLQWSRKWSKLNPAYRYHLWDEESILKLPLVNRKLFIGCSNPGIKSDIARYEILSKFGGYYFDTDFEPIKPIDRRLGHYDLVSGCASESRFEVYNGFIASSPNNNVINSLVDDLPASFDALRKPPELYTPLDIMTASGPYYLTRQLSRFLYNYSHRTLILPSQYFYPWPSFMRYAKNDAARWFTSETIACHHWHSSWSQVSFLSRLANKIWHRLPKPS